ncbi:MAG: DUF262 domain-containing protein [Proteobacteria bacterium]|nr:DUF262 domain-containing protein [Pseudomonadota bacterium]
MSNLGSQIIYKQLLQRHGRIRIPMIQRDYAQGRPSEDEVREDFLNALEDALKKPADDPTLPLNLDFIYGSVEGDDETRFLPLDGQQRLTTLFLLHWYLAWKGQQWDEFGRMFRANGHARFSYSVRPSSNEFFDELVVFEPAKRPEQIQQLSNLITDQSWYFRSWRLDPTIQSSLVVLDAIHGRFASADGLFERLISESQPAITFQLLDLDNFGLSDDLYIKMNARGKPLTAFETFKARYEQELEKQFEGEFLAIGTGSFTYAEFVARRMDTLWADLFWAHRNKSNNLYDDAVMNLFRAVALITRNPESSSYLKDIEVLRNEFRTPTYSDFHYRGWLDREFTITLIRLLEAWSGQGGALSTKLPDQRYFNEASLYNKLVNSGAGLSYMDAVQFAGYAIFIKAHHENLKHQEFQEWMRVIYNLSVNTTYDRSSDLQRSMGGLQKLAVHSSDILTHFATSEKPASGFNEQQVAEEKLKAELLSGHSDWRSLIDRAEAHGYFRGQIEFLFDFSGVIDKRAERAVKEWENEMHRSLQGEFENYWEKADKMFSQNGLNDLGDYLWQRALLCLGDYLLPSGRNYSFLVNSSTHQSSWKRLLRGTGPKVPEARKILHRLWDRLAMDRNLSEQLDEIIKNATGMEPWREVLVQTPGTIGYCQARSIRRKSAEEVYLLKRIQMNGTHAELFSYSLYQSLTDQRDQLHPLQLHAYGEVIGTYEEPHIAMALCQEEFSVPVRVLFENGQFVISIDMKAVENHQDILAKFCSLGFQQSELSLSKITSRTEVESALKALAQIFTATSTNEVKYD